LKWLCGARKILTVGILTQQDNSQENDRDEVLVISSDSERKENNVRRKEKKLKLGKYYAGQKMLAVIVSIQKKKCVIRTLLSS
jgi:hypothetical protein